MGRLFYLQQMFQRVPIHTEKFNRKTGLDRLALLFACVMLTSLWHGVGCSEGSQVSIVYGCVHSGFAASWLVVCRGCKAACCYSTSRKVILAYSLGAKMFPSFQTPLHNNNIWFQKGKTI